MEGWRAEFWGDFKMQMITSLSVAYLAPDRILAQI